MDLFEYQGKSLYANYDIAHPNSFLVNKIEDLEQGFNLNYPVVVKAQVQVGGRGKAGGIKLATNNDELITHTNEILGMDIKGHTVEKILIEEASDIKEEYYLSFTLDRSEKKYLMMLSAKGGMDIEAVAEENPDDLTMIHIDPSKELDEAVLIDAITNSKLNQDYQSDLVAIITRLFKLFISGDCDLVEVNPLAITSSGVMALDSKVSLDMNAKYRHENFDQIEKQIYDTKENLRVLNSEFEKIKLEHDYLSSAEKLLEYQFLYFEDELIQKDIENIKIFKIKDKIIQDLKIKKE